MRTALHAPRSRRATRLRRAAGPRSLSAPNSTAAPDNAPGVELETPNPKLETLPNLSPLEREIIGLSMRAGQLLGLPKSVGAIYGLLYLSPHPLTMEGIMGRLRISLGSASQGLRQLRSFKAVRPVYVPGARREHFEAEDQFRKLIGAFLGDEVNAQLDAASERLESLAPLLESEPPARRDWLRQRLDKLQNVNANARRLLSLVARFLT